MAGYNNRRAMHFLKDEKENRQTIYKNCLLHKYNKKSIEFWHYVHTTVILQRFTKDEEKFI